MYKDLEVETSYKYLKTVISNLSEPICILGGWAVFFAVNENYRKHMSRVYIGSRDIDMGFNSVQSIKKAASILENKLKFKFISFRLSLSMHLKQEIQKLYKGIRQKAVIAFSGSFAGNKDWLSHQQGQSA